MEPGLFGCSSPAAVDQCHHTVLCRVFYRPQEFNTRWVKTRRLCRHSSECPHSCRCTDSVCVCVCVDVSSPRRSARWLPWWPIGCAPPCPVSAAPLDFSLPVGLSPSLSHKRASPLLRQSGLRKWDLFRRPGRSDRGRGRQSDRRQKGRDATCRLCFCFLRFLYPRLWCVTHNVQKKSMWWISDCLYMSWEFTTK